MFEIVCYNKFGSAFHRFNTDETDTAKLMELVPAETFGILIHDTETGCFLDRM
jgi:hypothetical protein